MYTVLAIDAAWTPTQPSGVALLQNDLKGWRCVGLAPSYTQFCRLAGDEPVSWDVAPSSSHPNVAELLKSAEQILHGKCVDVVTIDMPISLSPITARRSSDRRISQEFGYAGCSTHSPSVTRPGKLSDSLREKFLYHGYELASTDTIPGKRKVIVEVYPHPALLKLMKRTFRLCYKVSKRNRYWPNLTPEQRKAELVKINRQIVDELSKHIADIGLDIPDAFDVPTFTSLKRYEDAIDALLCGWVGIRYLEKSAKAYGDSDSAIWVPI